MHWELISWLFLGLFNAAMSNGRMLQMMNWEGLGLHFFFQADVC
jgi:hypothetical protein